MTNAALQNPIQQSSTPTHDPTLTAYPQVRALNPQPSSRRNGKIARLPKATRDTINRMLDDGFPYRVIIDKLGQPGEGLNAQNLTNWKQGGYQEWVKNQQLIERSCAQTETAIDFLQDTDGAANTDTVVAACHMIGATQLMTALLDHGNTTLKNLLAGEPENYIRILNTVCRLAHSNVRSENHRRLAASRTGERPSHAREQAHQAHSR